MQVVSVKQEPEAHEFIQGRMSQKINIEKNPQCSTKDKVVLTNILFTFFIVYHYYFKPLVLSVFYYEIRSDDLHVFVHF